MKTAIYVEDGTIQVVITPETEFEKNVMASFRDKELDAKMFNGSFYDCRGGWVRQSAYQARSLHWSDASDDSLIVRATLKQPRDVLQAAFNVEPPT